MRLLSVDTGAKRMGWCVLDCKNLSSTVDIAVADIEYVASGVMGLTKPDDEQWQPYRLRLIRYWANEGSDLLARYNPTHFANETMPVIGVGKASAQSVLANAALSALQTIVTLRGLPIHQVAAVSVKARIGGGKSATKPKVRDGVISLLPELAYRKKDWTKSDTMDEPDAVAVGLVALGCRNPR
jgi:Holliday junction resolvasome RuvABC endonuclease subunit